MRSFLPIFTSAHWKCSIYRTHRVSIYRTLSCLKGWGIWMQPHLGASPGKWWPIDAEKTGGPLGTSGAPLSCLSPGPHGVAPTGNPECLQHAPLNRLSFTPCWAVGRICFPDPRSRFHSSLALEPAGARWGAWHCPSLLGREWLPPPLCPASSLTADMLPGNWFDSR